MQQNLQRRKDEFTTREVSVLRWLIFVLEFVPECPELFFSAMMDDIQGGFISMLFKQWVFHFGTVNQGLVHEQRVIEAQQHRCHERMSVHCTKCQHPGDNKIFLVVSLVMTCCCDLSGVGIKVFLQLDFTFLSACQSWPGCCSNDSSAVSPE